MKKCIAAALAAASIGLCSAPASANGIALEANGARAHDVWGGELGLGYNLNIGPFTLRPIAGAFVYKGDNDRYVRSTFSNGQSRCRDLTNGQFATDEKCDDTAVKAYGKIEGTFEIPAVAEVGAGVRFSSEKARPYGTVGFALAPKIKVKANAGPSYYALGLQAAF